MTSGTRELVAGSFLQLAEVVRRTGESAVCADVMHDATDPRRLLEVCRKLEADCGRFQPRHPVNLSQLQGRTPEP